MTKTISRLRSAGIVWILLLNIFSGCSDNRDTQVIATPIASLLADEMNISASAEFVPVWWSTLSFNNTAQNVQILVRPGEKVDQGMALASSDSELLNLQRIQAEANLLKAEVVLEQLDNLPSAETLAGAEAALANAESNFERLDRAGARDYEMDAAQKQIDSAQIALDALKAGATSEQLALARNDIAIAQSALDQVLAAINATELKAPTDGTIVEIYAHNHENLPPLQPVLMLADLTSLQIETTDLSEVDTVNIKIGNRVKITVDALPQVILMGTVNSISLKAAPGSGVYYTVLIQADEIPDSIRWGMSAFVEFLPD